MLCEGCSYQACDLRIVQGQFQVLGSICASSSIVEVAFQFDIGKGCDHIFRRFCGRINGCADLYLFIRGIGFAPGTRIHTVCNAINLFIYTRCFINIDHLQDNTDFRAELCSLCAIYRNVSQAAPCQEASTSCINYGTAKNRRCCTGFRIEQHECAATSLKDIAPAFESSHFFFGQAKVQFFIECLHIFRGAVIKIDASAHGHNACIGRYIKFASIETVNRIANTVSTVSRDSCR